MNILATVADFSWKALVMSVAGFGGEPTPMEPLQAPEIQVPDFRPPAPAPAWHGPEADEVTLLIRRLARSEHLRMRPAQVEDLGRAVREAGAEYDIDPRDLVGIAWRESRFRMTAVGDQGRSCGAFQIRTDIAGRPSCRQAMQLDRAAHWAARYLAQLRRTCDPIHYLAAYNAGCRRRFLAAAQNYQRNIRSMKDDPELTAPSPQPVVVAAQLGPLKQSILRISSPERLYTPVYAATATPVSTLH